MANLGNTPRPAYVYDTETDTWVPIGVGAHTHAYIPNTLVDAKGDLVTATANDVPAILSKGADGTVLVSDSTTQTGLAWQPYAAQIAAGKNYLINGAFDFWQRGTTFTSPPNWTYSADRWLVGAFSGAIGSVTQQALTPGEIPDFDGAYFIRIATGTATDLDIIQKIEDVRKMAGKTVTLSFWTRTSTATNASFDYAEFAQNFGSGGSGTVATGHNSVSNGTWGTSWTRCFVTFNVPSISGKTIGANSHIQLRIDINNSFSGNWDITGVQIELGSTATPFSRAAGNIQGELAACQRYSYPRLNSTTNYPFFGNAIATSSTNAIGVLSLPVPMRVYPTSIDLLSAGSYRLLTGNANYTLSGIALDTTYVFASSTTVSLGLSTSGLTTNNFYYIVGNFSPTAYIGINAEL
jgi:hypothetical protein